MPLDGGKQLVLCRQAESGCVEEESDLSEAGAEGVHTEPGGTVDVVGGERFCAFDKAESFEWKAGILLLSIGSYHSLAI